MEKRYTIFHILCCTLISCAVSYGSPSITGSTKKVTPSSSFSSVTSSSSSPSSSSSSSPSSSSSSPAFANAHSSPTSTNDVYPRVRNTSLEYLRASQLVRELLRDNDRLYDVKVLPNGRQVSTYLHKTEVKRMLFPLVEKGPLTFVVTPCASPLAWTLTLRPRDSFQLSDYETLRSLMKSRDAARTREENLQSSYGYQYNTITQDHNKWDVFLDHYKTSNVLKRQTRDYLHNESGVSSSSINKSRSVEGELHSSYQEQGREQNFVGTGYLSDGNNNHNNTLQGFFLKINNSRGMNISEDTWSGRPRHPEENERLDLSQSGRQKNKVQKRSIVSEDIVLKTYQGYESVVFQQYSLPPGLYVLEVQTLGGPTHIHIQAKRDWAPPLANAHISAINTYNPRGVTLKWASDVPGNGYCLVISEGRSYPSLCAARAARERHRLDLTRGRKGSSNQNSIRGTQKERHHRITDPMLLLGCTQDNWYRLSSYPSNTLHVAVWEADIAGPPLGRGVVRPSRRTKTPRLRPGELMTLVPSAGGTAAVKFKVRRPGRRLHIMAVSCGAPLHLDVQTRSGESLGSAAGSSGALHMILRNLPTIAITLSFKTDPPGSATSLLVAAAHTTKTLPIPRLPRRVKVRLSNVTCTSAAIMWFKAPGNASYCVLVEKLSKDTVWRERLPRQCGWEAVAEKSDNFANKWCGPPVTSKRQRYTAEKLLPRTSYVITVLVRHAVTGRTLALPPKRIQTSSCALL